MEENKRNMDEKQTMEMEQENLPKPKSVKGAQKKLAIGAIIAAILLIPEMLLSNVNPYESGLGIQLYVKLMDIAGPLALVGTIILVVLVIMMLKNRPRK